MENKIVTFGEILMRLSPIGKRRIFQAEDFQVTYGGSETNVAVALANFGLKSEFVTRVPENEIALASIMDLRSHGVETDHIVHGGDRLGIYYMESPTSIRASKVIYDRHMSSFSSITPDMVNWENILSNARWFHWSGISAGLSQSAADTCQKALEVAQSKGITVSCDLNYRKNLWKYGKSAQEEMAKLADKCDILFGTEEEYNVAFGVTPVPYKIQTADEPIDLDAHKRFFENVIKKAPNCKKAFVALRNSLDANRHILTGLLYTEGKLYTTRTYFIEHIVDCVGVGDSFAAGMIYGLLNYPDDNQKILDYAIATSTLKNTISGDYNFVTTEEVLNLMNGDASGRIAR